MIGEGIIQNWLQYENQAKRFSFAYRYTMSVSYHLLTETVYLQSHVFDTRVIRSPHDFRLRNAISVF